MSATISISNFGNGNVTPIDGNTLTIQFDRASEKRLWVSDDRGEASFANSSAATSLSRIRIIRHAAGRLSAGRRRRLVITG